MKKASWILCSAVLCLSVAFFGHRQVLPRMSGAPQSALAASKLRDREVHLDPSGIPAELLRSGAASVPVTASLEMRENVDFLLTPALLVQEVVADGVVLTYPEE